MIRLFAIAVLLVEAGLACLAEAAAAQTLEKILERGVIVVGIRTDNKPFGFRDEAGNPVGLEPDLARDVAETLRVRLVLQPVNSANRMQTLAQGQTDLMIASMIDKRDRRRVVGIIEPAYYASGVAVLAPRQLALTSWQQLKGRQICALQGEWYIKPVVERYGPDILAFKSAAEDETALAHGECAAWLNDNTALVEKLIDPKWTGFAMPLPTILTEPWGLAVPLADRDRAFGRFMSGVVYGWHRSGKLIALERKWGIPPSAFLQEMQTRLAGASAASN
jgi:polar amino acid transport system substrate-binding protein